jgi:hypothetical protein
MYVHIVSHLEIEIFEFLVFGQFKLQLHCSPECYTLTTYIISKLHEKRKVTLSHVTFCIALLNGLKRVVHTYVSIYVSIYLCHAQECDCDVILGQSQKKYLCDITMADLPTLPHCKGDYTYSNSFSPIKPKL